VKVGTYWGNWGQLMRTPAPLITSTRSPRVLEGFLGIPTSGQIERVGRLPNTTRWISVDVETWHPGLALVPHLGCNSPTIPSNGIKIKGRDQSSVHEHAPIVCSWLIPPTLIIWFGVAHTIHHRSTLIAFAIIRCGQLEGVSYGTWCSIMSHEDH
jgi:hypothetical protein